MSFPRRIVFSGVPDLVNEALNDALHTSAALVGPDLDKRARALPPTDRAAIRALLVDWLAVGHHGPPAREIVDRVHAETAGTALAHEGKVFVHWAGTLQDIAGPELKEARDRDDRVAARKARTHADECSRKLEQIIDAVRDALGNAERAEALALRERADAVSVRWEIMNEEERITSAKVLAPAATSLRDLARGLAERHGKTPASCRAWFNKLDRDDALPIRQLVGSSQPSAHARRRAR